MKTASLPSLRVDPELRAAAESVLREGETLSSFLETAVKQQIDFRKIQADFVARGLASRDLAKQTGRYHTSEEVLGRIRAKLDAAKAARKK
ncbi:putative transcriptional regulator [Rhizobium sp. BK275]|uniref:YlcI/YnfO family protein n=1 Tax=unclassified Rhizobium TaxID=2613769 RepID=UPI00161689C1|nr:MULTISPECIES: YlcI/YnfO family protein [unclassified Rhizobium]MBB3392521.1 putative transcriptional regulator [Rhizobium sp. BK275]MBB3408763.1 putative transcriptional regulator [Rhizobium sp. BK316]